MGNQRGEGATGNEWLGGGGGRGEWGRRAAGLAGVAAAERVPQPSRRVRSVVSVKVRRRSARLVPRTCSLLPQPQTQVCFSVMDTVCWCVASDLPSWV